MAAPLRTTLAGAHRVVLDDRGFNLGTTIGAGAPVWPSPRMPICAPSLAVTDAVLNPTPGAWWFYVTVNLDTGETLFAVTY